MIEGCGSRLDGDFGEELDMNLFNFWDFPLETVGVEDFVGDWDDSSLEFGSIPLDALIPPTTQGRKVDPFPVDALIDESHKPKNHVGIASDSCTNDQNISTESDAFQTQSPDSVLESSSSCSTIFFGAIPGQPRSRTLKTRPRVKPWNLMSPWYTTKPISRKTSYDRKNKRRNQYVVCSPRSSGYVEKKSYSILHCGAMKKCTHCEITKTPQWREGPLGPKTLCNACGVRYRSGRLFPEYRPAASPTFVPDRHSNSHRKVLEMRNKATPHERN